LFGVLREKKNSDHFDESYPKGTFDGLYWAGTTTTTVGYGDVVTKTSVGRLCALFWMLLSYFGLAIIAGTISSLLVVNQFQTPPVALTDIQGQTLAAIRYSQGFEIGRRFSSNLIPIDNYTQANDLLANSSVLFVMGEQTSLAALNYTSSQAVLSGLSFDDAYFAYTFSPSLSAELVSTINQEILMAKISPFYDNLLSKYFSGLMISKQTQQTGFGPYIFLTVAYCIIFLYGITVGLLKMNTKKKEKKNSQYPTS